LQTILGSCGTALPNSLLDRARPGHAGLIFKPSVLLFAFFLEIFKRLKDCMHHQRELQMPSCTAFFYKIATTPQRYRHNSSTVPPQLLNGTATTPQRAMLSTATTPQRQSPQLLNDGLTTFSKEYVSNKKSPQLLNGPRSRPPQLLNGNRHNSSTGHALDRHNSSTVKRRLHAQCSRRCRNQMMALG